MKKNLGKLDATIRILVAIVIGVLYVKGSLPSPWDTVGAVVAVVFLLTSALGTCPLYTLFGINTCKTK